VPRTPQWTHNADKLACATRYTDGVSYSHATVTLGGSTVETRFFVYICNYYPRPVSRECVRGAVAFTEKVKSSQDRASARGQIGHSHEREEFAYGYALSTVCMHRPLYNPLSDGPERLKSASASSESQSTSSAASRAPACGFPCGVPAC
jgi:hypothetical protein